MDIKHFIFTNFGIGIFDELWLLYRFDIFENTVLPSLNNQTNKNFEWIVFIDENLPEVFKNKVKQLEESCTLNMHFIEVIDYSSIIFEINKLISNVTTDCLITSRIDDDDCLHENVIQLIRDQIDYQEMKDSICVISLNKGFEFLPSDNCMREVSYETLALGLTLVDCSKTPRSVTQYAHHQILDTLKKQGHNVIFKSIQWKEPLYLYTKHPLSDSYFFGARARILSDKDKINLDDFSLFNMYGITHQSLMHLKNLLKSSPIGMPHKYLEKLGSLRTKIKKIQQDINIQNNEELEILEARKRKLANVAVRPNPNRYCKSQKIRVAILGSCVSRDLFEIQKETLSKFEISFYSSRSSVVSYMSLPNTDKQIKIPETGFEAMRAKYDLEKSHWEMLENSKPDIIMIDFIDERIGLIRHNGSFFSASGPMIKAFERSGIQFDILRPWNNEIESLRAWSIKYFLERVKTICPNILIHKASWAEQYYDANDQKYEFKDGEFGKIIELNNLILKKLFTIVEESDIPVDFVGGEIGMIAANIHKWGFSPIHYDERYYKTLAGQLLARVI